MEHLRHMNGVKRELTPEECTKLLERFITSLGYRKLTADKLEEYKGYHVNGCSNRKKR